MEEDPYSVLGFPDDRDRNTITEADIKAAYRRMMEHHPDKLGGSNYSGGADIDGIEAATARMQKINAAYHALTKKQDKKSDDGDQNVPGPGQVLRINKAWVGDIYHEGPIEINAPGTGNVTSHKGSVYVTRMGKVCGNIKVTEGRTDVLSDADVTIYGTLEGNGNIECEHGVFIEGINHKIGDIRTKGNEGNIYLEGLGDSIYGNVTSEQGSVTIGFGNTAKNISARTICAVHGKADNVKSTKGDIYTYDMSTIGDAEASGTIIMGGTAENVTSFAEDIWIKYTGIVKNATAKGRLDVKGTVLENSTSLGGMIAIARGGLVKGDATAYGDIEERGTLEGMPTTETGTITRRNRELDHDTPHYGRHTGWER